MNGGLCRAVGITRWMIGYTIDNIDKASLALSNYPPYLFVGRVEAASGRPLSFRRDYK